MHRLLILIALTASGCERQAQQTSEAPAPAAAQIPGTESPSSKPPPVVPVPRDQAELDRMILAGYTPHSGHLHAPGVNECPLSKGSEAVM